MRKMFVFALLVITGLYSCKQTATEQGAEILLNDKAMVEGVLTFEPGLSNIVRINPDWNLISASRLKFVLMKRLPDGSKEEFQADVVRGNNAEIALGPMTAPAVYEYRAGDVYQTGYSVEITLRRKWGFRPLYHISLNQGLSDIAATWRSGTFINAGEGRLIAGDNRTVLYNPMYGIEAPLGLSLHQDVLYDQDDLRVQFRLTPAAPAQQLTCRLHVTSPQGDLLVDRKVNLEQSEEWQTELLNPGNWGAGDYSIALYPQLDDRLWHEGPEIIYRRRDVDPGIIYVSPVAPWTLQRDETREEVIITDFREAAKQWGDEKPAGWDFVETESGMAILNKPGIVAQPLALNLPLTGTYAVFVQPYSEDGAVIQAGDEGLVRVVRFTPLHHGNILPGPWSSELIFLEAADFSGEPISLFGFSRETTPSRPKSSGLKQLVLIPVTTESVNAFYKETSEPPVRLHGVNDWAVYFHTGPGSGCVRLKADQFETLLGAQAELGMHVDWSIGRSWVEYDSKLPNASRFPAVPYEEALKTDPGLTHYHPRIIMINEYDPLGEVFAIKEKYGKEVNPWLAMNRHYGMTSYGGMFSSQWFKDNRQWWQWQKNASSPRGSAVCYFFPEVRKERTDIFLEVVERGAEGLLVGACRQVPMLLYNPEMIAAYRKQTGIDPLEIDAENREEYTNWITWRADFFTQVLRELRESLIPLEEKRGNRVIVSVRIPSSGIYWNLAQGLDVEQWLREGLVDRLQVDPLEERGGTEPRTHDIIPYISLGQKYGIPVFGGIGATWAWGRSIGPVKQIKGVVPALHRALGLIEAGVDGIEIYETEDHAVSHYIRWVIPLFGNSEKIVEFLNNSNMEAVYPVTAISAMYGYDNHSRWSASGWNIYGMGGSGL